jgi:hypothetical protein
MTFDKLSTRQKPLRPFLVQNGTGVRHEVRPTEPTARQWSLRAHQDVPLVRASVEANCDQCPPVQVGDVPAPVELWGEAHGFRILCGLGNALKRVSCAMFGLACTQSGPETRQLPISLQPSKALGRLHAGGGPAQRHLRIAPSFDVATHPPQRALDVLDRIGAGKRSSSGRPSRLTVRISSSPSRMLAATPGAGFLIRAASSRSSTRPLRRRRDARPGAACCALCCAGVAGNAR